MSKVKMTQCQATDMERIVDMLLP